MDNNMIEQIKESIKVLEARADECPYDSQDYFKLMDEVTELYKVLADMQKTQGSQELELKKYNDSKSWKNDWKFWVSTLVPVAASLLTIFIDNRLWYGKARALCEFELKNTFTTWPGKAIGNSLKLPNNK